MACLQEPVGYDLLQLSNKINIKLGLSISVASLATLARHPNEVGYVIVTTRCVLVFHYENRARTGLALALSSFGSLGAAPVQGALLGPEFDWNKPIIFSGVRCPFDKYCAKPSYNILSYR